LGIHESLFRGLGSKVSGLSLGFRIWGLEINVECLLKKARVAVPGEGRREERRER